MKQQQYLLTPPEAAERFGVSERHIKALIEEATKCRKSRWRFGRELVDLAPLGRERRRIRINPFAVVQGLDQVLSPHKP